MTETHVIVVTEYASKGSLFDYLKSTNVLPKDLKEQWAIEAAEGIKYLKDNKILHRDIKSPNIVITADKPTKDMWFRYSKRTFREQGQLRAEKVLSNGKLQKSFTEDKLSPKADVFAFGVVLWELETCQEPYEGKTLEHVMWKVGNDDLRPEIPNSCSPTYRQLMQRSWDKDRSSRPEIEEILDLLKGMICMPFLFLADIRIWKRHLTAFKWEVLDERDGSLKCKGVIVTILDSL